MYKHLKRIIDFLLSFILLITLSPVLIITILALFFANKGKVFFLQKRPGFKGEIFKIIKFKTMNDKCDKSGQLLPDHLRTTYIGNIIRKYSIDEIPQLINVLKGDMSLIGPRPLLVEYLPLYSPNQAKRHNTKPGITGWAQINGRNAISWNEKFKLDIWYVDNICFLLDIKILFLTFKKLFDTKDVNASSNITMEKFNGNN